jgi:hypothetical protein
MVLLTFAKETTLQKPRYTRYHMNKQYYDKNQRQPHIHGYSNGADRSMKKITSL